MKNAKRILAATLSMIMLIATMVVPASAVTGSKSYSGEAGDYKYTFTLSITDTSAIGTVDSSNHGILVSDPNCSVGGYVTYIDGKGQLHTEAFYGSGTTYCIASVNNIQGTTQSAKADFIFLSKTYTLSV